MYKPFIAFFMVCIPTILWAEDKVNVELTAYIPGFGIEYQIDAKRTVAINYSALQSANVSLTIYNHEAFTQSGAYKDLFLGYGDDSTNGTGLFSLGKYMYLGSVIGYQWVFSNGVNLKVDGGLMIVKSFSNGDFLPAPAFAASVGYAFDIRD